MRAKVTLKGGFRYYRLDGTCRDLAEGDIIEADDIPRFVREDRFRDGHLTRVAEAAPEQKPPPAAHEETTAEHKAHVKAEKAQARADQRAEEKAERLAEDRAASRGKSKG